MKKLFALSLAALMVMGLATVAFAADPVASVKAVDPTTTVTAPEMYTETDSIVGKTDKNKIAGRVDPGKTAYIPLLKADGKIVDFADAVKSVSVSTKYTLGNGLVDSIKVIYKKHAIAAIKNGTSEYGYFLAITFKTNTSTAVQDFAADITLKKTSGVDKTAPVEDPMKELLKFELTLPVNLSVNFAEDTGTEIGDSYKVYNFSGKSEETYTFAKFDGAEFEVDVNGQSKTLIKADAKYDPTVAGKYPDANIDFFNGYGATFNKIGELRLPAEPGSYLYDINADGTLKAVAAEYDDGLEAFVIKTRILGHYAISDTELEIAPVVEVPAEEPETPVVETPETPKPNANTGAAA